MIRARNYLIIGYLLWLQSTSVVLSVDYYVAPWGTNTAQGSFADPWYSLDYALRTVNAGDTVNLAPGEYANSAFSWKSGTYDSPITIRGQGSTNAIITGRLTIRHSNIVVEGLHFNGIDLRMTGTNANYNLVHSNLFSRGAQGMYMVRGNADGSGVNGPSFNQVVGNTFTRPTGNGCVVTLGTSNLVSRNLFVDLDGYDALRVWGVGTVISDNRFRNTPSGTEMGISNHADIIQTFADSTGMWAMNIVFERNIIEDNRAQFGNLSNATRIPNMRDWIFRNNVFINSRLQINIYLENVSFYNNTAIGGIGSLGFRFASADSHGNAHGGQVFNNIFIRCQSSYSFETSLNNCVADYNIITALDDGVPAHSVPEGANGIIGGLKPEDVFVDPENHDLRLCTGSPAINAGLPTDSVQDDFLGQPRSKKPGFDRGAYVFWTRSLPLEAFDAR